MKLGKAVARGSAIVLLPMVLSGCGLPIGVQIASWAVDGFSYLTTEKSVTAHGLSAVTQQDCAIWRVFKGEAICRETAANIELAEAAKLDDEDDNFDNLDSKTIQVADAFSVLSIDEVVDSLDGEAGNVTVAEAPVEKATPVELAIIEIEAQRLDVFQTAAGPASVKKSIHQPMPLPGIEQTSATNNNGPEFSQGAIHVADAAGGSGLISRPLPPPVPSKISPVSKSTLKQRMLKRKTKTAPAKTTKTTSVKPVTDEAPVGYEPVVKTEPVARPLPQPKPKRIERPKRMKRKTSPAPKTRPAIRRATAQAGLYYVLGSFARPGNAYRLAKKAAALQPKVVIAHPRGQRVHRVLVGPFAKTEKNKVRLRIRAAKIRGIWILRMKTAVKTERQDDPQLAALPR